MDAPGLKALFEEPKELDEALMTLVVWGTLRVKIGACIGCIITNRRHKIKKTFTLVCDLTWRPICRCLIDVPMV